MGLFGLGKKEKAKKTPKKEAKEDFEIGSSGARFTAIIELVGSPKKYVSDTLEAYVKRIKQDNQFHVFSSTVSKPKKAEKDEKDPQMKETKAELFSAFVELDIGTKHVPKVFDFCFTYMPSSMEVIEPSSVNLSANDFSKYLTDIQGTLHQIDFALKQTNATNQVLNQRLQILNRNMVMMLQNNIILSLREKDKEISNLAKNTGVPAEQLKPFLDKLVAAGEIKLNKDKYSLSKK